jgi:hypothetical protein
MHRILRDMSRPGDIVVADRVMCSWTEMVVLKKDGKDGVDSVTSLSKGKADFRRGKRLGKGERNRPVPRGPDPSVWSQPPVNRAGICAIMGSLTSGDSYAHVGPDL